MIIHCCSCKIYFEKVSDIVIVQQIDLVKVWKIFKWNVVVLQNFEELISLVKYEGYLSEMSNCYENILFN